MAKLIGNRYASSLFEVGLELEKVESFYKELDYVNNIFKSEDKLFQIFTHPRISKDEKKSLINEVFKNNISVEIVNLLYIVIDKKREKYLFDLIENYKSIYDEHEGIVDVDVVTAVTMEESAIKQLEEVLKNKLAKKIRLNNEVDKSIIGGVLLKIDDKIIDDTLINRLRSIETSIKNISI